MLDLRYIYQRLYDLFDIYDIEVELDKEIVGYSTVTINISPDIRKAELIPKLLSKIAMWIGVKEADISLVQGEDCYHLIINSEPQGDLLLSSLLERLEGDHKEIYSNPLSLLIGVDIFNTMITLEIGDRNPHVIIAGSSGSGKTSLLHNIISSVLERDIESKKVDMLLYTPKADLDCFNACDSLRYDVIKNISDIEVCLSDVYEIMLRREKRAGSYKPILIVLDEVNSLISLSDIAKGFIEAIAMKGRSSRVHLILSMITSKKSLIQSNLIRENASAKIIMRVSDKIESNALTGVKEINCSKLRIGEAFVISSLGYARVNIPIGDLLEGYPIESETSTSTLALVEGGLGPISDRTEARDTQELRDIESFKAISEEVLSYLKSNDGISVRKLRDGIGVSKDKASAIIKQLDQIESLLGEAPDGKSPRPINKDVLNEVLSVLSNVRPSVLIN